MFQPRTPKTLALRRSSMADAPRISLTLMAEMVSAGPHHTQIGAGGKSGSIQAGTCTGDLDLHDRDKFTQTTMVSPAR